MSRVSFDFSGRFLPPVYILVFIVGLLANGWGLMPLLVVYYLMGSKWIFGDVFCKITRFCFNLNLYGSIGFLTCISVFRYLAIPSDESYGKNNCPPLCWDLSLGLAVGEHSKSSRHVLQQNVWKQLGNVMIPP
ncbi:hypothetical protein F7725_001132 [Dissostichus mawsoni]|uniref:G-protein coupled receptors family 1 profile domain-containing protein n=1 Tax=Dissostichus mawsoni TaxID=36200 RepID=A0A7J5ZJK3_DISMA|nr:hypothetical protein F7725_001132 [Dissostichus mawsoni]